MNVFRKPHIDALFPKAKGNRRHPYPRRLFREHDIFELCLLDGGAFFFGMDHLGSNVGRDWIEALEDGSLLKPWMVGGKLNWDQAFDESLPSPCRVLIERHVWLNRLYFLLPIAQEYFRTGDERWARMWYRYFRSWLAAHPYIRETIEQAENSDEVARAHKFCWHDMQVALRLLVFIHSTYLLEKSSFLKRKRWFSIYKAIRRHGLQVHGEAAKTLADGTGSQNHFPHQAVALLYAGILFPEIPEANQFVDTGRKVIEFHARREILPDGGSIEASPSYSHFIARLHLDAYLLLKGNGLPAIPGLKRCITSQYKFLHQTSSPAGLTLQVSDSYAINAGRDLALVNKVFSLPRTNKKNSVCFHDSRFAVLRNEHLAVYLDGLSPQWAGMWHVHEGKPNILAYVDGRPLLVDSGCCNYDKHILVDYFQTARAHNVVLISPVNTRSVEPRSRRRVPAIKVKRFDRSVITFEHSYKEEKWSYVWIRTVRLSDEAFEVKDRIRASVPVNARQIFHFAPWNVRLTNDDQEAVIHMKGQDMRLRQKGKAQRSFSLAYRPAMGADNLFCDSAEISSTGRGREISFSVEFSKHRCELSSPLTIW